jgi:RNA polymerase sigma-70 factor (ECF subfamily)
MTKTETFLEYRPFLFSVAYNMLGVVADAEDIVQDTYEKWLALDISTVQHPKSYLVKTVTNRSINHLNKIKKERENYIGQWMPEPLVSQEENSHNAIEIFHPLSIGIMVMMEKLTPQERAVFLLKEIFSYDYDEIAEIIGKTYDNCRQIFKRASQHLKDDKKRFQVDVATHERIFKQFLQACTEGDMEGLIAILQEDIVLIADGGGASITVDGQKIGAVLHPIYGAKNVASLAINVVKKLLNTPGFKTKFVLVNNMPALASFIDNKPISLITLEVNNDAVINMFIQSNPEKLKSLH